MREEFAIIKLPEHVKLPDNDSKYQFQKAAKVIRIRTTYSTIPTNSSCQVTRDAFEEMGNSSKSRRTRDGTKNSSLRHQKSPFLVLLSRPAGDYFLSRSSDEVGTRDVLKLFERDEKSRSDQYNTLCPLSSVHISTPPTTAIGSSPAQKIYYSIMLADSPNPCTACLPYWRLTAEHS